MNFLTPKTVNNWKNDENDKLHHKKQALMGPKKAYRLSGIQDVVSWCPFGGGGGGGGGWGVVGQLDCFFVFFFFVLERN